MIFIDFRVQKKRSKKQNFSDERGIPQKIKKSRNFSFYAKFKSLRISTLSKKFRVVQTIKRKNTEHTIIITVLLKLRKSNIHVGEYRPQKTSQRKKTNKGSFVGAPRPIVSCILEITFSKCKEKIRSTQSSSLFCSNSGSQIFTSVNTGHRKK